MTDKAKGRSVLGALSFKRKSNSRRSSLVLEPEIDAPPLPASAMGGKLNCCPLTSAQYAESWALMTKLGRRPKVSRLYGNLDGVLADAAATQHFINHQKANNNLSMYNFWKLTKKYVDEFPKKSVEDRNTMAREINTRFIQNCTFELPSPVKTQLAKVFEKNSDFKINVFEPAQKLVWTELQTKQFADFHKSPHYSHHCISVITSGNVYLEDMLYNESFLMGFLEYMALENASTVIQFWLIADDFQTQLLQVDKRGKPVLDASHAKSDAMGIFKRFFAKDASEPLGVDAVTLQETETLVCKPDGPDRFCFRRPLHLVYTSMSKHFFPSYMRSDAFYQYLNGLMTVSKTPMKSPSTPNNSTVSSNGDTPDDENTTAGDDEGSTKKRTLVKRDSGQLGLIDEWGVYQRDGDANHPLFNETSTDKSTRMGQLASVVGMKKKTTKEEHEMAVQVARMIVNQIYREMKEHHTIDKHVVPS
eukprot:m.47394 g.47394  ORF g.47394 m.47394 type:complete len:475 (-) comp20485_c0_seq1:64-1488(-)